MVGIKSEILNRIKYLSACIYVVRMSDLFYNGNGSWFKLPSG
jgi:hypothetical protein